MRMLLAQRSLAIATAIGGEGDGGSQTKMPDTETSHKIDIKRKCLFDSDFRKAIQQFQQTKLYGNAFRRLPMLKAI